MIHDLTIRNFRLFDELSINGLGRVNLIVGKNNSGKSAVLEALTIYASQGDPATLYSILGSHDENLRFDNPLSESGVEAIDSSFRHLFPNRRFPEEDGKEIYIGDSSRGSYVQLEHRLFFEVFEEFQDESGSTLRRRKRVPLEKSSPDLFSQDTTPEQALFLSTKNRSFWLDLADTPLSRRRYLTHGADARSIPHVYVPTDFITAERLASMWDSVALTEAEEYSLKALKIIDESVSGLAFVQKKEGSFTKEGARVAIVKISGQSVPIPLASMGDGMTRLLQLVLALFSAKGGLLLLDEFENGLHFSVQKQIWDMVFHLAKELDVQVFCTTHSRDCVEAFSQSAQEDTATKGVLFRLGRSVAPKDANRIFATVFDENRLSRMTEADIEVR
ncbi:AAA family ATPase [Rhodocyclus purpureus]|uniref:AAA family ATPase n=1 Tax=Rhodocyclus purpureus TaxID=1067 RepID=UPI001911DA43|nr:ATP-binding protein [Rhodocyclus purpureus]